MAAYSAVLEYIAVLRMTALILAKKTANFQTAEMIA